MRIVASDRLERPAPYKAATEKYSAQVKLNERGELSKYVKLLGIKPMLASVHAENVTAKACGFDNHRTVCPEVWEMR